MPDDTIESQRDPWADLARFTPARIALGRSGASQLTREVLRFGFAHAQARDAVHLAFDSAGMETVVGTLGYEAIALSSAATTREIYLRRPDLGRRLSEASRSALLALPERTCDVALVVADGLSSTAIHRNLAGFLTALKPQLDASGYRVAPVAVVTGGRVALGDEIGALLRARASVVLIGERPGLSSPDSLGLYLTFDPKPGRSDADRNCISNVRQDGLSYEQAASKLVGLLMRAMSLSRSGIDLKDDSDLLIAPSPSGNTT